MNEFDEMVDKLSNDKKAIEALIAHYVMESAIDNMLTAEELPTDLSWMAGNQGLHIQYYVQKQESLKYAFKQLIGISAENYSKEKAENAIITAKSLMKNGLSSLHKLLLKV